MEDFANRCKRVLIGYISHVIICILDKDSGYSEGCVSMATDDHFPRVHDKSSGTAKHGGYEFKFVQGMDGNLEDIFVCKICHLPSRDPQLSVCCGHTFCKSCLDGMKRSTTSNAEVCPVCREDKNFGVVPNKQVDRKVRGLRIFCTNKEKGCEWQGELNDLNVHINESNDNGCMYQVVQCTEGCGETLRRQYLSTHVLTDCMHRKINCQYCDLSGIHSFITGDHKEECPKVVIPCPNHCETDEIFREDMDEHRKVCPFEVVSCKYMKLGCGSRMARKEVEEHLKENVEDHLHLALERLEKLENTMETVVAQLKWSCYLTSEVASGSQVAPVVFRITESTSKKSEKAFWRSPHFYTTTNGYRMYARAAATFDESHLQICMEVGVNENDHLNWPLRGKFDMAILNQISDCEHYSKRIQFDDRCSDDVAGRNATTSWGFPRFISYDRLNTASSTCQYVKDDSMYIKVSYSK